MLFEITHHLLLGRADQELAFCDIFIRVPEAVVKKGRGFFFALPCCFTSILLGSPSNNTEA